MGHNQYLEHYRFRRRRKQRVMYFLPYAILTAILVILLCIAGYLYLRNQSLSSRGVLSANAQGQGPGGVPAGTASNAAANPTDEASEPPLIQQADRLAAGYDYDAAIKLLQSAPNPTAEETARIAQYEQTKNTLVRTDPYKITHIFFHSLIIDTSKAFDGDSKSKGYNQMMATKDEFKKIIQSMYDKGFVLVRLHDVAHEVTADEGTKKFVQGDIMLPPGKQAFVMSQDDVCYYEYMDGDGFASRIIIGPDGKPTCEMKQDDGSMVTGEYDLIPILDDFIDKHPDFSYKGARAVIALTGYNGILGYRTDAAYDTDQYKQAHPGFDFEKERADAKKVAQCLKDNGYELASHSWGHRQMGTIPMDHFIADTDKWESQVEPLTGPSDIILFPFGSDIGDWHPYTTDNQRYDYLHSKGFRYFCNVDARRYWVQIGDDYMRQGRRNIDGFRMYYDLPETNPTKDHLSDLFDVSKVFDRRRPVPVPKMGD